MELNFEIWRTSLAMSRSFSKLTCKYIQTKLWAKIYLPQVKSRKEWGVKQIHIAPHSYKNRWVSKIYNFLSFTRSVGSFFKQNNKGKQYCLENSLGSVKNIPLKIRFKSTKNQVICEIQMDIHLQVRPRYCHSLDEWTSDPSLWQERTESKRRTKKWLQSN